ncbi:hypothetical protein FNV65_06805 [Streptomyces sp. S1A1-8]|nr:hypothetical protein FNV58_08230 [Streptomyces sp. RLB1-9]QDO17759.1 hypothetical protein FNV65_06805 [Streptomyces sp. S1A1-8]QDO27887.1 hypothetical protein FNV63_06815 [Streptomyces sp. S1A1-3]
MSVRVRHTDPPTPSGCRWCGEEKSRHGRRWVASAGVHSWEAPTREQRLSRMKARRSARLAHSSSDQ